MNNEMICSNCDEVVAIGRVQRRIIKGKAFEFFHVCANCEFKHIAYYTNGKIRQDIKKQQKRWERYRQAGSEESERRLLAEIQMNDRLIEKDMDGLMKRMETLK